MTSKKLALTLKTQPKQRVYVIYSTAWHRTGDDYDDDEDNDWWSVAPVMIGVTSDLTKAMDTAEKEAQKLKQRSVDEYKELHDVDIDYTIDIEENFGASEDESGITYLFEITPTDPNIKNADEFHVFIEETQLF